MYKRREMIPLARAVELGDHEAVAQLLADPSLVIDDASFTDAMLLAATKGHDKVIAQLLAANPACIDAADQYRNTALHFAAYEGHDTVVAQLLAAKPACIDAVDHEDKTVLYNAALGGHTTVISQLLAAKPALLDAVDCEGRTALHVAVSQSQHAATKQLLAAKPELIKVLDNDQSTPFAEAAKSTGHGKEELLALGNTPEEIEKVDIAGFGTIRRGKCCHEMVTFLYNLYPEAATLEVDISDSPFLNAVVYKNEFAIELLQWKLSFDDIVDACTHEVHDRGDLPNYVERYQPIMETQCEALFPLLGDDVMGIVFECLGLEARNSKKKSAKRQRV